MTHTKGPWQPKEILGMHSVETESVFMFGNHQEICRVHKKQDAIIIAAAPELLYALEGIMDIGKRDMSNPKYDAYFQAAKEAINKARKI